MKSQFTRPSRVDFTGSFDWEVQGSAFDALRSMSSDDIRNLLFSVFFGGIVRKTLLPWWSGRQPQLQKESIAFMVAAVDSRAGAPSSPLELGSVVSPLLP